VIYRGIINCAAGDTESTPLFAMIAGVINFFDLILNAVGVVFVHAS
jgi:hypothetical protein